MQPAPQPTKDLENSIVFWQFSQTAYYLPCDKFLKFRPEVRQLETTLLLCAPHYWGGALSQFSFISHFVDRKRVTLVSFAAGASALKLHNDHEDYEIA